MEENLKLVLQKMFEIANVPFPDDEKYFKKEGWYQEHTWTSKQEKEFLDWFVVFVKKNWQGVLARKQTDKRLLEKAADGFNLQYGFKTSDRP